MFHRYYPSEISFASQRLEKLKSKHSVEQYPFEECGYKVELISEGGRLQDIKLILSPELVGDDFLLGHWLAQRELMRGRGLLELSKLSFREWESFFRDYNHQLTVAESDISRCEELHQRLSEQLVEEIFNHAWDLAIQDLPKRSGVRWSDDLAWLGSVLERFFLEIGAREAHLKLLSWRSLSEFPLDMSLTLGHSKAGFLSEGILLALKNFLSSALGQTKEIKLVAE